MALVLTKAGSATEYSDHYFELAQLSQAGGNMLVASPMMGSCGCCALEYHRSGHATVKSDVYSFWVVLV